MHHNLLVRMLLVIASLHLYQAFTTPSSGGQHGGKLEAFYAKMAQLQYYH